ncbi:MAG: hypothetical protein JO057_18535 [Chloroflexi bacterium]|nr:hypothetical protein [Chloroflexota bacterium]
MAQIRSAIQGQPEVLPSRPGETLPMVMMYDAELFRAFLEINSLLALPRDVMARPGMAARIMEVAAEHPPEPLPGPSREELLRLVA